MRSTSIARDDQPMSLGTSPYEGPQPFIRDALEASRMAWRRTPEAMYPGGYLGTVQSRRSDKLVNAIWRNQKSYHRGVHKGERIDMSDYLWPDEFNLMSALVAESKGQRYVSPAYAEQPVVLTRQGRIGPSDLLFRGPETGVPVTPDPNRASQLKRLLPSWGV